MKITCPFLLALCITACSKPVPAPVPDLPLPIKEAPIAAPAVVEAPKTEVAPAAGIAAPAIMSPDAAPTLPAPPESAPVIAAPVK